MAAMGNRKTGLKFKKEDELLNIDLEKEYNLIKEKKSKLPAKIRKAIVQKWEKDHPHIVTVKQRYRETIKQEKNK
jgi:topoisomerase IA-like protein